MTARVLAAALASAVLCAPARAETRPSLARSRRWAVFYGANLSQRAWADLDLAIVDPDRFQQPLSSGPAARLAYVSAGEADEHRASWPQVKGKPFLVEPNPDWPGAHRADPRSQEWRAFVGAAVSSALAKGYDGVMLDTLDVADYLESSAPARFAGSREAAAGLVLELRRRNPEALILVNNGLALLERIGGAVDGIVVEDLYTRCAPSWRACAPTPPEESAAKEAVLTRFAAASGKPVFVILYARLEQRRGAWIRAALARVRELGFLPYLAGPTLERLGSPDPAAAR